MERHIRRVSAAALIALVAVSAAFVVIGGAGAGVTAPAAEYAQPESLMGSGQRLNLAGQPTRVNVSALSGPNGKEARGTFQVFVETAEAGTVSFRGKIHCLTVEGNRAAARGTIEKSTSGPNPVGTDYQIQVTDNKASGTPDTNINIFGFGPGDVGCPFFDIGEVPLTAGNFRVHDAG